MYEKYIMTEFGVVLSNEDSNKLYKLYSNIYENYNPQI